MAHKGHAQNSGPINSNILLGILYGLAFFLPGVYLVKNGPAVRDFLSRTETMPMVMKIAQDFQTGVELAGERYLRQSTAFYRAAPGEREQALGLAGLLKKWKTTGPAAADSEFAWTRNGIEAKLEKEFGQKRMRQAAHVLDYVEQYRELAALQMARTGIPASIILAQGLLESDAGRGYLARVANNHFGVKCRRRSDYRKDGVLDDSDFYHHELAYGCEQRADDHPWDRFEKYETAEQSFQRHSLLLTQGKRYNWMLDAYRAGEHYEVPASWFGVERAPYYVAWAIGLKTSGYATSKRYAQKISWLVETYDLWRIDYSVVMAL